ncbi:MAG TPA: YoaK family protein [Burkholderiaceae bacterium]|nr:YoaK family protein [Burkholderiaceae bacterium]
MPIDYARRLTGRHRSTDTNRHLGFTLAFVAGATNAGAYLAVKQYTSHMTGIVSSMADHLVLGEVELALGALGGLLSFIAGAATSAVLVNYARRRQWHSEFALPLLLEAVLLLCFGLLGAQLAAITGLFVPATVMLLCFMMGLQNAVISKLSNAEIRTTHLTGVITDIGIELGKLFYWNRHTPPDQRDVLANRDRLRVLASLSLSFFGGGVSGALGFKHVGYSVTIPLALVLVLLAGVPAMDDLRRYLAKRFRARGS